MRAFLVPYVGAFLVILVELEASFTVAFLGLERVLVELVVAETDFLGVLEVAGVVALAHVGPLDGAHAHGAGVADGVDFATGEVVGAEVLAGVADGHHLAVAGGVAVLEDFVVPFSDDFSVLDDDGSERSSVLVADSLVSFVDCLFHENVAHR